MFRMDFDHLSDEKYGLKGGEGRFAFKAKEVLE